MKFQKTKINKSRTTKKIRGKHSSRKGRGGEIHEEIDMDMMQTQQKKWNRINGKWVNGQSNNSGLNPLWKKEDSPVQGVQGSESDTPPSGNAAKEDISKKWNLVNGKWEKEYESSGVNPMWTRGLDKNSQQKLKIQESDAALSGATDDDISRMEKFRTDIIFRGYGAIKDKENEEKLQKVIDAQIASLETIPEQLFDVIPMTENPMKETKESKFKEAVKYMDDHYKENGVIVQVAYKLWGVVDRPAIKAKDLYLESIFKAANPFDWGAGKRKTAKRRPRRSK